MLPFHLMDYWRIVLRRRWTVVTTVFAVLLVAGIGTWKQIPIYRATLKLQLDPEQNNILPFNDNRASFEAYVPYEVFFQTQLEVLTSRTLASRVIREKRLDRNPDFVGGSEPTALHKALGWARELLSAGDSQGRDTDDPPPSRDNNNRLSPYAGALVAGIEVKHVPDSRVIYVSYDAMDPALAADILNTLASEYIRMNFENRYEAATSASEFLAKQLVDLKMQVEEAEEELVKFGQAHDIYSLGEKEDVHVQKLYDLNSALTRAQAERIQKESVWKTVQQTPSGQFPDILRTDAIRELESNVSQLRQQQAKMRAFFKPGWPEVKQLEGQLAEAERQLAEARETALEHARIEYQTALQSERLLSSAVEAQKLESNAVNRNSIQYNILKREVESSKQLYDGLLLRTKEAGVAAGLKANNIHVVDPAEPPAAPFKPNKLANMSKALAIGLLVGVVLAFFTEYICSYSGGNVKTPYDIDRFVKLPFLGLIPSLPAGQGMGLRKLLPAVVQRDRIRADSAGCSPNLESAELIMIQQPRSVAAEAYRDLRTSVLLSACANGAPQSILITSSGKGEGKTTTAINLGAALAQSGKKVLLVDCDMRNPSIARALGLENSAGIGSVLSGNDTGTSPVIQESRVHNVFVLPAGAIPDNPAELIGSQMLRKFLQKLRGIFDHIIIDSPPVLSVTDARILATLVDGVILVIRGGHTTTEAVQRSKRLLLDVNARILGTMLNNVDMRSTDPYYYSAYQYDRYGYGYK